MQDCILFRHTDLAGIAEKIPWLPKPAPLASYLSLVATPFAPCPHPDPAASWAPLALLPNPKEALLIVSRELQRAMFTHASGKLASGAASEGGKEKRPRTALLAGATSRSLVGYCNATLADLHLRAYHLLRKKARTVRATALAMLKARKNALEPEVCSASKNGPGTSRFLLR